MFSEEKVIQDKLSRESVDFISEFYAQTNLTAFVPRGGFKQLLLSWLDKPNFHRDR